MAKDFKEAATALKGKAVLADVDATVEKDLVQEYGVRGFPTLKLFSKGEVIADYKGGRKKDDFIKYIERALLPAVVECSDKAAVEEMLKENKGKNIFIGVGLSKLTAAFKKESFGIRDLMPDTVTFASVTDVKLLDDIKGDSAIGAEDNVLLVREDGTTGAFDGKPEELETWVKVGALPLLGELNRESASLYTELPKPLMILFQDPAKKDEKIMETMTTLATEMRSKGEMGFVWVNSIDLKSFMEHVGVKEAPGIAVYKFDTDTKWKYDGESPPTLEGLREWTNKFIAGEIKPTIKSAPIPETNDEPVKVVVADSWKAMVEDESKDVLIEQYAPWCGHCKSLAPILTDLATDLKDVNTIMIAKMDATENDSPPEYKAKGFPTMHFFPAGKGKGIPYDGGRKKEDFIKFFKEHATYQEPLEDIKVEEKKEEEKKEEEKEEL